MESKRIVKSVRIGDQEEIDAVQAADPASDLEETEGGKSNSTTGSDGLTSIGGSNHVMSGGACGPAIGVKMTKSVLFDSRSTAHSHCKKVQSGIEKRPLIVFERSRRW